jgi:transcriptional regulator with XRE-family HTH domain
MDSFYGEIGGRMRGVRTALRLTQAQVAEAAGIDASFYGQIERGVNTPSLKTFVDIAYALKTDAADLLPRRAPGRERLYEAAVGKLLSGLDPKRKAMVLGLVKDIVARYRAG